MICEPVSLPVYNWIRLCPSTIQFRSFFFFLLLIVRVTTGLQKKNREYFGHFYISGVHWLTFFWSHFFLFFLTIFHFVSFSLLILFHSLIIHWYYQYVIQFGSTHQPSNLITGNNTMLIELLFYSLYAVIITQCSVNESTISNMRDRKRWKVRTTTTTLKLCS